MMKTNKRISFLLLLIMVVGVSALSAQSKQEKKELREKAVKEQVESENYKVNVSTAHPQRGRVVHLTSIYSVEVRNDSVYSYLPYYGRAYSIPYGGGDGLNFAAPINEYKMETHKKGAAKIEFTAPTPEDRFKFILTIFANGSTDISVSMQNRESIRFLGELILPSESEGKSGTSQPASAQ